jgi:hypothetical protein
MIGMHELHALAGLIQELERLAASVRGLESRLAGSRSPGTDELRARLAGASQHFEAARAALAGGPDATQVTPEGLPLSGSSRTVPIQDLLSFLATTQRSGILQVESEHEGFLLQLQSGAVVYAKGDAPPPGESLRDLLASRGVPSPELLGQLPERAASGSAWVDRSLLGTSWIGRDALSFALQQQTRLSFFRLCSARDTHFRFHEGAEIQNLVPVRHSAMELLLEYSRAVDEGREPALARGPRGARTAQ